KVAAFIAKVIWAWMSGASLENVVHRVGGDVGERLRGIVQQQGARRVAKRGGFREPAGDTGVGQGVEGGIQHVRPHSLLGYRMAAESGATFSRASSTMRCAGLRTIRKGDPTLTAQGSRAEGLLMLDRRQSLASRAGIRIRCFHFAFFQ